MSLLKRRFVDDPGCCVAVHCVAGLGRSVNVLTYRESNKDLNLSLKGHETLKPFLEILTYMYRLHITENNNSTRYVYYEVKSHFIVNSELFRSSGLKKKS